MVNCKCQIENYYLYTTCWQFALVVARWSRSSKLLCTAC